jgi:anti-sigma factor RsiW
VFASREVAEERQAKAAENWRVAKKSLKRWSFGCLALVLVAAFGLFYLAGYVAAMTRADCLRPEVTSTP